MKELEIYIHIPFCVKKCAYCDFLSGPSTAEQREHYIKLLREELLSAKGRREAYTSKAAQPEKILLQSSAALLYAF